MSRSPASFGATLAALIQTVISVATFFVVKEGLLFVGWDVLATLRALGAAVLFSVVLAFRWDRRPRGRDLAVTLALGLVGVTLNQLCYAAGMSYTTPARASLLYALSPLLILVIGAIQGTERFHPQRMGGLLAALAGVALVLSDRGALQTASATGDVIILFGACFWAAYSALGKPLLEKYDALTVTAVAQIGGAVALVPFGLGSLVATPHIAWQGWAAAAFLALFTSFIAYSAWSYAIRRLPPSAVGVFMNLQPPATMALAWALFGDPLSPVFIAGAVLVLLGVAIARRKTAED